MPPCGDGPRVKTARKATIAPYITLRSDEESVPLSMLKARTGVRAGLYYLPEVVGDRDAQGVLWARCSQSRDGDRLLGSPGWRKVHPARQRECMAYLQCQVCVRPASRRPGLPLPRVAAQGRRHGRLGRGLPGRAAAPVRAGREASGPGVRAPPRRRCRHPPLAGSPPLRGARHALHAWPHGRCPSRPTRTKRTPLPSRTRTRRYFPGCWPLSLSVSCEASPSSNLAEESDDA